MLEDRRHHKKIQAELYVQSEQYQLSHTISNNIEVYEEPWTKKIPHRAAK